jgi:NAD(P)-dependent dehydrogenase (short-subunit alcohol dehydrogenase family)
VTPADPSAGRSGRHIPEDDRAVLVTGAARRVGRAIALDLGKAGWRVAVHYCSSAAEAAEVVDAIRAEGGRAAAVSADLGKEEEVGTLVDRAAAAVGPLTCLVNNASIFEADDIETVSRTSWERHLAINLRAPLVLIQAFARQLPAGSGGNVVNIIDERVWNLTPHFLSYTVSKAGLWTLTQTLATALAPRIRINAIGPGPVLPSHYQTRESFERLCRSMPLRRGTSPAEIAGAVRFLIGTASLTGQMIALDGGQHLGWLLPDQDAEMAAS